MRGPQREYTEEQRIEARDLILRVSTIDEDAAAHLLAQYDAVIAGDPPRNYMFSNNVDRAMLWEQTPQGRRYWSDINAAEQTIRREERDAEAARVDPLRGAEVGMQWIPDEVATL